MSVKAFFCEITVPGFQHFDIKFFLPDSLLTPTIREMLENGWYEVEEANAVQALLRPGDKVLELGGGAGFLAALCGRKVGAANVVTVEANPKMIPLIKRNLAANGQSAITVVHGAVLASPERSTATFFVTKAFWAAASKKPTALASEQITVPALALDSLLERYNPSVLIVDVEGAEEDFFLTLLPENLRLIIIELHPENYPPKTIRSIFARLADQQFTYETKGSHGPVVVFAR